MGSEGGSLDGLGLWETTTVGGWSSLGTRFCVKGSWSLFGKVKITVPAGEIYAYDWDDTNGGPGRRSSRVAACVHA